MNKKLNCSMHSMDVKEAGQRGGKAAAKNMTPAQRSARAKKAVAAREAKRKKTP